MTCLFVQCQHIGQCLRRMECIIAAIDDRDDGRIHETMGRFGFFKPPHNAVHVAAYVFYFTGKITNRKITVFPELVIGLTPQFFHSDIER